MIKLILYVCLSICLVGCKMEYEDVSTQENFSGLIGSYMTLKELKVHGITENIKNPKIVNGYHITLAPGLGGPEIVTKDTMEPGSVINIKKVMQCVSCQPSSVYFVVEIFLDGLDDGMLVWLDDLSILDEDSDLIMSPEFFSKLESTESQ